LARQKGISLYRSEAKSEDKHALAGKEQAAASMLNLNTVALLFSRMAIHTIFGIAAW